MQYQGHKLHHESSGAIPKMYYRHDGYDSYEMTPEEGYYYNPVCKEYANDSWGSYRF
jgi:hypothetical protein